MFLCVAATILVSLRASSLPGHSGGQAGKEGVLATTSLEFNYVHLKVEAKCRLVDMTLNDVITLGMCFLMFVYIHTCLCFVLIGGNLTVDGEPQGNWIWNSNSRDVVASSPSFSHPATRAVWVLFNVFSIFSSTSLGVCLGESTRLPSMWPRFKSRHRCHMWVEFVVGSLPCSKRFFSGYSGFLLSSKTNTFKFQFDLERTDTFKRFHMNS